MKQFSHIQHTAVENLLGNVKKADEPVEKPVETVEKPMFFQSGKYVENCFTACNMQKMLHKYAVITFLT